jgi:hypothetical protein
MEDWAEELRKRKERMERFGNSQPFDVFNTVKVMFRKKEIGRDSELRGSELMCRAWILRPGQLRLSLKVR